jgi:hypothetical protein
MPETVGLVLKAELTILQYVIVLMLLQKLNKSVNHVMKKDVKPVTLTSYNVSSVKLTENHLLLNVHVWMDISN